MSCKRKETDKTKRQSKIIEWLRSCNSPNIISLNEITIDILMKEFFFQSAIFFLVHYATCMHVNLSL